MALRSTSLRRSSSTSTFGDLTAILTPGSPPPHPEFRSNRRKLVARSRAQYPWILGISERNTCQRRRMQCLADGTVFAAPLLLWQVNAAQTPKVTYDRGINLQANRGGC